MSYIMLALGFANGTPCPHEGQWLSHYDPDAADGQGWCDFTDKIGNAMKFETKADALACWNAQSKVKPLRPDGKPNKPLTALSVLIEKIL